MRKKIFDVEVDSLGNIYRFDKYTKIVRLSKLHKTHRGYLRTCVNKKLMYVHRVVALAFIPNPKNNLQVNHKNGIKTDNRAENLEWVTNKENQIHAWCSGLNEKTRNGIIKSRSKPVLDKASGLIYPSAKKAAESFNINYGTLKSMLSGHDNNNTSLTYM